MTKGENKEARPTVKEFEAFMGVAKGVQIFTFNDPDSSPPDDEDFLRELAAEAEGRKVGRPRKQEPGYRKARREEYLALAVELSEEGKSVREIAREISLQSGVPISPMGVSKWLKRAENRA